MRGALVAILAALAATPVLAATKCPARFNGAAPAWGPSTAADWDSRLYQPPGLEMLGRRVAYVVVKPGDYDLLVYYRLSQEVRHEGRPLSQSVRDAFAASYPDVTCSELKASCTAWGFEGRNPGDLESVRLQDDDPPGYEWKGAGARVIAADKDQDYRPVYLICGYER